jgi:DNA repair protein RecN (Recombination protein N)
MLKRLTIKNYALIKALEMEPTGDLNVITGETGAGKSIMLGAIGLLTGNRADTKVLWDQKQKCITEGVFDIRIYNLNSIFNNEDLDYDDLTVIRREISPSGKSRAFINDTPVTLEVMKRIGGYLLDIHSQYENVLPGQRAFQLQLIDGYAGHTLLKARYAEQWIAFQQAKKKYEDLVKQADDLRNEEDYVSFQLDELVKAGLEEKEQDMLESDLKVMEHAEEIKTKLQQSLEVLSRSEFATRTSLADARNLLYSLLSFGQSYSDLNSRIEGLLIELDDMLNEIERLEQQVDFDPERAEFIKERLSTIYRLQKKHKVNDILHLIAIQEELQQKAALTSNLGEALMISEEELKKEETELGLIANKLSESRRRVFPSLIAELTSLLNELGISEAQLRIEHRTIKPQATGADDIEILFSANKGIPPRSLTLVASGGEFSRLMFCIKYIMAERASIPTLILDEIDSGISGEIAIKLGKLMKAMAEKHQLIAITHLPQIAAKGDTHYFVYKDNSDDKTVSNIKLLDEKERIQEIAQMIGGAKPSPVSLQGAKEMLNASI